MNKSTFNVNGYSVELCYLIALTLILTGLVQLDYIQKTTA